MKNFFGKLAAFFRKTWVWSLCLVLVLALLVWFVGPLLAVNDYKFWESATSRLLTISGLFLVWGLAMVFASWKATARKKAEEDDADAQERMRREGLINDEQVELRNRFKQALHTLKRSSLYRGRSDKWRNDLPWYLMLGPQGSGKTSLLDFSGLDFPLNRGEQQRLTKDVSGTRYADWYFADHAVLIDTAGRYMTQPDPAIDSRAWDTLLGLLRKRRARPLNGVLVNIPVELLQNGSEIDLENLARQTRQRLQEIHQRLGADVPVYLVLSKADKVLGFDEFFDQLSREESDQVLGASFRKEQNATDVQVIRQEFEELLRRLNSQVILRMHQERDTQRRGRILDFPHQLGLLGERLCLFSELAFSGNRYQRASQLRGFYLTSAPELSSKLDPSTSSIGSSLGLDSNALPTFRTGRSRFINHLLSRVIFPESDLAGLDQKEVRRIDWGQRAMYATALVVLGVFGVVWANGFSGNHGRLEQLRDLAQQLTQEHGSLSAQDDTLRTLKALDHSYAATQVFPPVGEVSYLQRGGLYQGEEVDPTLQQAYRAELETLLLSRVGRQLEAQVRANLGDRERLLNSLRAYLMLNLEERRDKAFLQEWMAADWSLRYAGNSAGQRGLNTHFERLLSESFAPYSLNEPLVAQARQVLRSESLANVVYRMLREEARSLPDYRLSQKLGPQATLFAGSDYVIPGFYTQVGYQKTFTAKGADLVRDILRDNWVLGEGDNLSSNDLSRLLVEMEQLYFRDYANYWGEAIAQLSLEPIGSAGQGARQLASLTAANSPLLQLLVEVRDNTRFKGMAEAADDAGAAAEALEGAKGKLGKVAKLAGAAAEQAQAALVKNLPDTARKTLERRFEPLHRLLDDNAGAAPELATTLQALDALQLQLAGLAHASAPEQAAFELAKSRMAGQRDAINQVRSSAARLPQPVGNWLGLLAEDSWMLVLNDAYHYLNQRYKSELYAAYDGSLKQRYPFSAHSESDVAIADFREFFKAQGIAERFFDSYLKPFVSGTAGQYQLRRVDGRGLPLSREFLLQMSQAQTIRRSFFAENPNEPKVLFKLEPYSLDSSLGRADFRFGNQQLEYRHGPIVQTAFSWPAEADDGRTSLVVEELGGRKVGIEKNTGPWSLFRLLDLMSVDYHSGRDVLMLKADLGGLRANYLLHSQRSPNPFDLAQLRSFKLPATL
ncbi:MAG: type VI secretion system membrane subunit TssM [Gammaproteobacteria bacterium]|nr:type VI secretion system membrane subunit TssM [Gammaproteobacteria bacterium]MBU1489639.1 type VI secretion system membrane subunit TssM [Gammaproteobacteria bacterium]MBU2064913.1 type VI secretion system membrane subunit TssM [Gammaproteobacteria bacterium]MBU2139247.1 type VI secretion system membrane subunit TssM [Gammaproteobacteria bacterium]MBU2215185.1 type VI secretion system membrane subunit TssM [Gammaproteobacteria bacterium]